MTTTAQPPSIIQPYDLPEEFVSGVGACEMVDGLCRIVFYAERNGEKVAKFALIIPVGAAVAGMAQLANTITGNQSCGVMGKCVAMSIKMLN